MKKTKKIVFAGAIAALCCIGTLVIVITIPGGGYFNLGDCFVITSGVVLGPLFGFFAAGIGSMIADLFGYAIYAPATFLIKGLMALIVGLLYKKSQKIWVTVISTVIAEFAMILGYFTYELILYGFGTAVLGVTGNMLQGAVGIVSSVALITLVTRNKAIKKFLFQ